METLIKKLYKGIPLAKQFEVGICEAQHLKTNMKYYGSHYSMYEVYYRYDVSYYDEENVLNVYCSGEDGSSNISIPVE